ncbi:hypothetical protein [Pseudonocardia xishanensis]|uniref:Roadblock/LAMTOR2 domain-containing protein n=1 Tax=Pseudonocardia xishanensis TaxID=630995 RepID=A0ABP8RZH8_9PSEU
MPTIPGSPGLLRTAAADVLRRPEVLAAALVDVASGLTLDAVTADRARLDVEAVAAAQVEAMRGAAELSRVLRGDPTELVVRQGNAVLHVLRPLPDPGSAAGLLLSVLVAAPERNLRRVRKALDRVDPRALVPAAPPVAPRPRQSTPARREGGPAVDPRLAELARFESPAAAPPAVPAARSGERGDTAPPPSGVEVTRPLPVLLSVGSAESQVNWFDPVVPGSPPPPRRSVVPPPEADRPVPRLRP